MTGGPNAYVVMYWLERNLCIYKIYVYVNVYSCAHSWMNIDNLNRLNLLRYSFLNCHRLLEAGKLH